jgi:hypothetical protein
VTAPKPTNLSELVAAEAKNFDATTKHLGTTAELLGDLESVYQRMTPLLKSPGGSIESSDETLAAVSVFNEFIMCRMLLTKAGLSALRMYQAEAFANVRRAIESCSFAVRMSKHPNLARIWAEAGLHGEKYRAYRKEFRTEDVFPKQGHPDYDPILWGLKDRFDDCSKLIHGSIFGMANHLGSGPEGRKPGTRYVNFFDMPRDSFVSSFLFILHSHDAILRLFGQIMKPHTTDFDSWEKEFSYASGKLQRHTEKWMPNIRALFAARNNGQTRDAARYNS